MIPAHVPTFGIGECGQGVFDYSQEALLRLCERLGIDPEPLTTAFMDALRVNAATLASTLNSPYVPTVPESRRLLDLIEDYLVGGVRAFGLEHVGAAQALAEQGNTVLLVSNHTSGADTLVLDRTVNDRFGSGTTAPWTYMSGHAVNLFLLPLVVSAGVSRIQIFSAKHASMVDAETRAAWQAHNVASMRQVAAVARRGGQMLVLYPEGGRGENHVLLPGEPRTMGIPQLLAKHSPGELYVLPSYVEATDILPVWRDPYEFNAFLELARRGSATLAFGAPRRWSELQPGTPLRGDELRSYQVREIMQLIANLAPAA